MADYGPQHELEDELLSAYLDGELTPEECAAVERRLAIDPAARQMLNDLRHVSNTVGGLPEVAAGDALRNAILQRIEAARSGRGAAARPAAAELAGDRDPSPNDSGGMLPRVTIGRSPRAWIWASLAIAAGLLIMVFQPEEPPEENVKQVAQRSRDLGDVPELRAAPESGSAQREIARSLADSNQEVPTDSLGAPAAEEQSLRYHVAAPPAAAPASQSAGALATGTSAESSTLNTRATGEQLVVHVLAKRAALESGSFEKVLMKNGIAVEEAALAEAELINGEPERPAAIALRLKDGRADADRASEDGAEYVFVEAPYPKILSCIAALNEDSENYPGLVVEDSAPEQPSRAPAVAQQQHQQQLDALARYNRGLIPKSMHRDEGLITFSYQTDSSRNFSGGVGDKSGGLGDKAASGRGTRVDMAQQRPPDGYSVTLRGGQHVRRRGATRAAEAETSDRSEVAAHHKQDLPGNLAEQKAHKRKAEAQQEINKLQVLFVLKPEDQHAVSATDEAEQ